VVRGGDGADRDTDDLEGAALTSALTRTSVALRVWLYLSCALLVGGLVAQSDRLLRAGLIALTAMPLALLVAVTVSFLRARDGTFATISIGVLLLLALSLTFASR
jgi:uncharacterized membrane protein